MSDSESARCTNLTILQAHASPECSGLLYKLCNCKTEDRSAWARRLILCTRVIIGSVFHKLGDGAMQLEGGQTERLSSVMKLRAAWSLDHGCTVIGSDHIV
eukprot:jgi/Ulvmu1/607/UM001_0615.1